jgi:hypothetical protein
MRTLSKHGLVRSANFFWNSTPTNCNSHLAIGLPARGKGKATAKTFAANPQSVHAFVACPAFDAMFSFLARNS